MKLSILILNVLFASIVSAADVPMEFEDPQLQQRYQGLLEELRCLVCQNQSLADSHAELAQDLRNQVYRMVEAGESNEAITGFLVTRYGDFVLYRPPLKKSTLLLWLGPFVLLIGAFIGVYLFVRSRKADRVIVSADDQQRLNELLGKTGRE